MNGKDLVKIVDAELDRRSMTQQELCKAIGIQSSAYSAWRKGATPRPERIKAIEEFLDIDIYSRLPHEHESEATKLVQTLLDREDLRILLKSAQDVPASSVYALISQIEKMKENETDREL